MGKKNHKGFSTIEGLLILILIVIVGFAGWYVYNSNKKTNNTLNAANQESSNIPKASKQTKSSTPPNNTSLLGSVGNTSRKDDAASVTASINEYIANNEGFLPQSTSQGAGPNTLEICGSNCKSTNSSTVNLRFYAPSKVSFQPYSEKLKVPDTSTVYIVDNAQCNGDNSGIGTPQDRSVALLFALQENQSLKQQCQSS